MGTLTITGCQAPATSPKQLHARVLDDFQSWGGLNAEALGRQTERYQRVHEWHAEGALVTTEDFLWSAAALVTSDEIKDLNLALELALQAAELGDKRGFTVQAEATDKLLVRRGKPQRYGTQYVFETIHQRWKLFPVDPRTTDVERRSVGIPPLAELMGKVDAMNAAIREKRE